MLVKNFFLNYNNVIMENKLYDVIIVGGGPAGLTASIYALRAKKSVLLIEKMMIGGQVALTTTIENYPGFELIDGVELSEKMFNQASKLGLEVIYSDVLEYNLTDEIKQVKTYDGTIQGKTIILCMGATAKPLDVENEKDFIGKGISYCATCDGNFYKNKTVAIVGGGDSAIDEALYLADIANKIYLIHRRDSFKNEHDVDTQKVFTLAKGKHPKIEILTNSSICGLLGKEKLEKIIVENKIEKTKKEIELDGVFVAIGRKPDTSLFEGLLNLDSNGYVLTDENMHTNIPGVFAAGDIRQKTLKQIVTACADGAIAATQCVVYIAQKR